MNIETEKLSLIKWLEGVLNSELINQLLLVKHSSEDTSSISELEKQLIDSGLIAIEEGRTKTHEQLLELTAKKYPNLVK